MISELHWTILEDTNRQLALLLAKLRKARRRDLRGIWQAEMDHFQALQHFYARCRMRLRASTSTILMEVTND